VGINLAIQDAVAAANVLSEPLCEHRLDARALTRVQARRALPTHLTQALQIQVHERVLGPALAGRSAKPPLLLRLTNRSRSMRRLLGRLIGIGIRSEHVLHGERRAPDTAGP
jgi:2-polyprenyl-6-methoxyphenol hydroxylase-like FAD-dependent oxidoreductase